MELPKIFSDALEVAQGKYYTPELAHVSASDAELIRMHRTAVTNDRSEVPVIGTDGLNPCTAIVLYNTKTKTAALNHEPNPTASDFLQLLNRVRKNDMDQVAVHIVGGTITDRDDHSVNENVVMNLTSVLNGIKGAKNVRLETFDVYNKLKPVSIAIDARNGNLIRGSDLVRTSEEGDFADSLFGEWNILGEDTNFDGTTRDMRKKRSR